MTYQKKLRLLIIFALLLNMIVIMPTLAQDGTCTITTLQEAVVRAEPDVTGGVRNRLAEGTTVEATQASVDGFGYVWWLFDNGDVNGWVREDLVDETDACRQFTDEFETGDTACLVTAGDMGANLRAGIGAEAELQGSMAPGETRQVFKGEWLGATEFWWQLTNGSWVRADLVDESAACDPLRESGEASEFVGADACVLTVLNTGANQVTTPRSSGDVVASIGAGDELYATEYAADLDQGQFGFWHLLGRGGTWVREDTVSETDTCNRMKIEVLGADALADSAQCVVTALEAGAILRAGAGTAFESLGSMGAGESRVAAELVPNEGGETWWQLTNGAFVLSTLVDESAECGDLGEEMVTAENADPNTQCVLTVLGTGAAQFGTPETGTATSASIAASEELLADRYSADQAGGQYGFWHLVGRGGTWVREDTTSESAGCDGLR